MTEPSLIEIRGHKARLTLQFQHRAYPEAQDYWDGNWVATRFRAEMPGIVVDFTEQVHLGDVVRFQEGLQQLLVASSGQATLAMMEEYLTVTGTLDTQGKLHWAAWITHPYRGGARLEFEMAADQSYLPALLGQVDDVLTEFPVRGR